MVLAIVISSVVGFGIGMVFKKYVMNEAFEVKTHVTSEVNKLRGEFGTALESLKNKI